MSCTKLADLSARNRDRWLLGCAGLHNNTPCITDSFIGVEVWGVGGKVFHRETRVLTQELQERFSLMGGGVIQQNNDWAAQVSQQLPQKNADLLLFDVVIEEQIVQAQLVSLRTQRNPGNNGDLVPSPLAMTMNGSLPFRRPGSDHRGDQKEAGFVCKYDMGTQPRSVFFTRGQFLCFQRLIFSSSRSHARRSGF